MLKKGSSIATADFDQILAAPVWPAPGQCFAFEGLLCKPATDTVHIHAYSQMRVCAVYMSEYGVHAVKASSLSLWPWLSKVMAWCQSD